MDDIILDSTDDHLPRSLQDHATHSNHGHLISLVLRKPGLALAIQQG